MTRFPHGLSSFGIPVLGSIPLVGVPNKTGKVWFVDAVNGSDGNSGLTPEQPFATIQKAINMAGDGTGDTIFVFPGTYAENLVVNKDYLTIQAAMVSGYAKPDIVPASGIALYNQAAQGMCLRRLRFAAPAADVDLCRIEGNGFIIDDCVFDGDATQGADKALIRLKGNDTDDAFTASEGRILNSLFRGITNGIGLIFDTAEAVVGVGETDVLVAGCTFVGNGPSDIASKDTGPGTYSIQRSELRGNFFMTKNKTNYIDFTTENGGAAGDQNGVIQANYFAADAITAGNQVRIVGTGFTFSGNFSTVGVVDGSGLD
jgi:hypothetical protein